MKWFKPKPRKNIKKPKLSLEDKKRSLQHVNEGKTHMREGIMGPAISSFKKALKINPRNPLAKGHLAEIYLNRGLGHYQDFRFRKAQKNLERVLEYDSENVVAHKALARIYYTSGMHEKSLEQCDWVLSRDPRDGEMLTVKETVHMERGETGAAKDVHKMIRKIDPRAPKELKEISKGPQPDKKKSKSIFSFWKDKK